MLTLLVNLKFKGYENWIINLSVFLVLCYSNIIISKSTEEVSKETYHNQPVIWPIQWNNGVIPFAFDFFALSPKRLIALVYKAHAYIEERSCLVFKEMNPVECARKEDFTYLFYTYSEVLESCCVKLFSKDIGRRLVMVTPSCFLQAEMAHAIKHAMGLDHSWTNAVIDANAKAFTFPYKCDNI